MVMIRRLFLCFVFVLTINMAAFGQAIFGRDDIAVLAVVAKEKAPKAATHVLQETDKFLAEISPSAGYEVNSVCMTESLDWAYRLYHI